MPEIYPKMTRAKLKQGARKTSQGKGRAPLPGVKTDAKHVNASDKRGYQANRELAELEQEWKSMTAGGAGEMASVTTPPALV